MAARVYDIYDLNSPMVTPTAPAAKEAAARKAARGADRLLLGGEYLLLLSGVLLLAGAIVAATPLGYIDADVSVPLTAVMVAALGAIVAAAMRA